MSQQKKLVVGQVGVGGFGGYRRTRMRETGLFTLAAAYDFSADALALAQKEDGAQPVKSFEDLINFPGLEAIIVSTGATTHAELGLAALKKGLHVFIEKPLCSTPEEMNALLSMQKKTGLVVGMGHSDHSTMTESVTVKNLVDSGECGKIAAVEATTCHSGGLTLTEAQWRADRTKNPGGMLFQCGVHKLHELMFYFGPITAVACRMRYDVHTSPTADSAQCLLEFASGLTGTLCAYHVTPYCYTVRIFGTKANLYLDNQFFDAGTIFERQNIRPTLDGKKEERIRIPVADTSDICSNLKSFYAGIREGKPIYPALIDGARAVAVVFAAARSDEMGGAMVKVSEFLKDK